MKKFVCVLASFIIISVVSSEINAGKMARSNGKSGLWADEIDYIKSILKPDFTVLEWGAGGSTFTFPSLVKEYYSIEHDQKWYEKIKSQVADNVILHFVTPNKPYRGNMVKGEDGTYAQFKDYVDVVHKIGKKFDLILIDGRARVDCAKACLPYLKEGGLVLIHDFQRPWYKPVLKYYNLHKRVHILGVLQPK